HAAGGARDHRCAGIVPRRLRRGLRPLRARANRGRVQAGRRDPSGRGLAPPARARSDASTPAEPGGPRESASMGLEQQIDEMWESDFLDPSVVEEAIAQLDGGTIRVAD